MTPSTKQATRAATYGRLSIDRNGNGATVDRQLADCRSLAEQRGWTVVEEFRDDSRSAWRKDVTRPGWEALLAAVESGEVDAVVVFHGDRLARQPRDLERLIDLVEQRGLRVASPSGERDLGKADDRAILRVEVAMQCRESDSTSRRVRRVFREHADQGRRHGFVPFGWRTGVPVRPPLWTEDTEADVVREMVARLLAGDSLRSIARDLNARGVVTLRGGEWSEQQVRQVAGRASNAGKRTHKGAVVADGNWPALVSTDDHERITRLLSDPARKTARHGRTHLLSGIARCGKCGGKMRFATINGRQVYRCERLDVSASAEPLTEFVLELVNRRLNADDAAAVRESGTDEYDALASRLEVLRGRVDGLAEDYSAGLLNGQQVKVATERFDEQIAEVEAAMREAERKSAALRARGVDVYSLSVERQRALLRGLLEVRVNPATKRGAAARSFDYDRLVIEWK